MPADVATQPVLVLHYDQYQGIVPSPGTPGSKVLVAAVERAGLIDKSQSWYGEVHIDSTSGPFVGELMFVQNDLGEVEGTLVVDERIYAIHALDAAVHALVDINQGAFPAEAASDVVGPLAGIPSSTSSSQPQGAAALAAPPTTFVRVLVLYTDRAFRRMPNIRSTINLAIEQTNSAYSRSGVPNVVVSLAGVERTSFVERTSTSQDILRLRNDDLIRLTRNSYEADLVVLLTDGLDYSDGGRAYLGPDREQAYGIVQVRQATTNFTFSHEVGHMYGADHHPDDQGTEIGVSYARGHRFTDRDCFLFVCDTDYYATIMAYTPGAYVNVLRYSNPTIRIDGQLTGTALRDNARRHRETASTLAAFRGSGALAIGASSSDDGSVLTSVVVGGSGSVTREWQTSEDGENWTATQGSAATFAATVGSTISYARVVARSSTGERADAYTAVVPPPDYCASCEADGGSGKTVTAAGGSVSERVTLHDVMPNPARGATRISFDLPEAAEVQVVVYDVLGREVARLANGPFPAGPHAVSWEPGELPSGTYAVRLQVGLTVLARRVTILR